MMEKENFDVVVVGAGMAGVCAAIEAAEKDQTVLLLDASYGGGASGISGGVVYAGGGTSVQQEGGVEDTIDNMFDYLKQEVGSAVSEETLRRFCEESPASIEWLKERGVKFQGTVCPYKTSYPTDQFYLYYSGNEKCYPYKDYAFPAPRGHRTLAKELSSGNVLMTSLLDYAKTLPTLEFRPLCKVSALVQEDGEVKGVRYRGVKDFDNPKHKRYANISNNYGKFVKPLGVKMGAMADKVWESEAKEYEIRAKGVVLSTGGFIFNQEMLDEYNVKSANLMPLGTITDDGNGINLGIEAGGDVGHMDSISVWRFISPPSDFVRGIAVSSEGQRILNEDLYGATFAKKLVAETNGDLYLIVDRVIWEDAKKNGPKEALSFQALQMQYLFKMGSYKAKSLPELAKKIGVPEAALLSTVRAYNNAIALGQDDPLHKAKDLCSPLIRPPFYAVKLSIKNAPFFPAPALTLGGLRVNEETGEVLTKEGESIKGLYAAGRSAVGICSNSYLSGLSLADGMFSGRRAARHIATVEEAMLSLGV